MYAYRSVNYENPANSLATIGDEEDGFTDSLYVTPDNAMSVPAIWCAIHFISGAIAGLPLNVYQVNPAGFQTVARGTHVHRLLSKAPNLRTNKVRWIKSHIKDTLLRGIGVSWVERNKGGNNQIVNIWKLPQESLHIEKGPDGWLRYMYFDSNGHPSTVYHEREIIDTRFDPEADRTKVTSPIFKLRKSIKLSMRLGDFADNYFENGGVPRGVISSNVKTTKGLEKAVSQIRRAIRLANQLSNGLIHLPPDHTLTMFGKSAQESQMEQSRRFQVEETARIYLLPPIFLQDMTKGTYQNTEQAGRFVIIHTLRSHIEQFQSELDLKLWGRANDKYIARFDETDLTRGDNRNRIEGQARMVQNGLRTPNEIRAQDNMPPLPGGDDLLKQKQLVPLTTPPT